MSILLLAFPDWIAIMNMLLAISPNVLSSPFILFTKHIPSVMHADGNEIDSAGATLLSICRARVSCWERADLLAPVMMSNCVVVTFPLVSWVRYGA